MKLQDHPAFKNAKPAMNAIAKHTETERAWKEHENKNQRHKPRKAS